MADDVELAAVDLDGVPGEWSIVPGNDASRVLLFFHGGGYCSGSIRSHRRMVTEAGRAAECGRWRSAIAWRPSILPCRLRRCADGVALAAQAGIAAAHIAVGGDSAGGGLTVALINRLRAAKEELPGCAWLVSPWTDLTMSGATLATKDAVDPLIHKGYLVELANAYLPPEWTGRTRGSPFSMPT